jgi:hypothetical protein
MCQMLWIQNLKWLRQSLDPAKVRAQLSHRVKIGVSLEFCEGRLELSNASVCADASLERGQCAALCMRGGKLELIGLLLEWGANPECRG